MVSTEKLNRMVDSKRDFSTPMAVRVAEDVYPDRNRTFKVRSRRARKNYPKESMEISADLGEALLKAFPELSVDVHDPQILLNVEIREKIYIGLSLSGVPGHPQTGNDSFP